VLAAIDEMEDNRKKNKLLYFRHTVKDLLNKVKGKTLIIFDTETTGLNVQLPWVQVTEIAAVAVHADSGQELGTYHTKINLTPAARKEMEREMTKGARSGNTTITDILGFTDYKDPNAPFVELKQAFQGFADFVSEHNRPIMVAQNAGFDMEQMFAPMKKLGIKRPPIGEVMDTRILASTYILPLLKAAEKAGDEEAEKMIKSLYKEGTKKLSFTLGNLGKAFQVQAKHWHSGISDTMQTYGIFIKMLNFMRDAEAKGLEDTEAFKWWHVRQSGQAFYYGKNPARGEIGAAKKILKAKD